jgi:hypothetical protein
LTILKQEIFFSQFDFDSQKLNYGLSAIFQI